MTTRRPRRWDQIALSLGAISATISILFAGWFIIWFQLFGDQPDRGDYAMASGLYAGGVLWLGIASLAAWLADAAMVVVVVLGIDWALRDPVALGVTKQAATPRPSQRASAPTRSRTACSPPCCTCRGAGW